LIVKVDPPWWWPAHSINPVRLLIRGRNLAGARVTSSRRDVQAGNLLINQSGTYAFASIGLDQEASAGDAGLRLEAPGGSVPIPLRIEPPIGTGPRPGARGFDLDDVIYLIMTDRFCDGDPANNAPAGSPAKANGRDKPRGWHGGDLRGVIKRLPYLQELGVTALWLTPWYDNDNGLYECDKPWCPYTYYHGYHPIDHYAVEDHFGDLDTLRDLVSAAHARGMKVIQDQVSNHIGLRHPWVADPPLADWLHGSPQRHHQNPFRGEMISSPHAAAADRARVLDGWFSDDSPDLDQDSPEVARYLIQNALWWVGTTGVDGIREDTAQYLPRTFLRELCARLHRQHPRLTIAGEVLDLDPVHTSFFLGGRAGWDGVDSGLDSVFDFPLWWAGVNGFSGKTPMNDVERILRADFLYAKPDRLITLTSNHDVRRFPSWPGASAPRARLQVAFTLASRGIPQLYYGDEIGMRGEDDPDNRHDFPGGFPGDGRDAFAAAGRTPDEQQMWSWTRDWIALRRAHLALRHGELIDLAVDADHYVFARRVPCETIVIALNRSAKPATAGFSAASVRARPGMSLVPLLGGHEAVQVTGEQVSLTLPESSAFALQLR
jgi:glycosidase